MDLVVCSLCGEVPDPVIADGKLYLACDCGTALACADVDHPQVPDEWNERVE